MARVTSLGVAGMALLEGLEIYIPPDAEVKRVPLPSLPGSVLRKMGLSAERPGCSDCVGICPVMFRRKGQKEAVKSQDGARERVMTAISSAKDSTQWKMSFTTANTVAYKVLTETLHATQGLGRTAIPQGPLSNSKRDTVIIHRGCIYLSVKGKGLKRSAAQRVNTAPRPTTPRQSTEETTVEPVRHKQLKMKVDDSQDVIEMVPPKLSDSGQRGACPSPRVSPRVSLSPRNDAGPSCSQWTGGTLNEVPTSSRTSPESNRSHGDSQVPDYGREWEHQDRETSPGASHGTSGHTGWAPEPHTDFSNAAHSLLLDWDVTEPSPRQQDFDFQELETRERIARMEAMLESQSEADVMSH